MKDLNQIVITGRLTKDGEQRQTSTGKVLQSFTVAVNDDFKAKDATEWTNRAYFLNVVYFGNLPILEKGIQVMVSGKLTTSTSETENGKRTYTKIEATNVYLIGKPELKKIEEKQAELPKEEVKQETENNEDVPF